MEAVGAAAPNGYVCAMAALSVLDLSPVTTGISPPQALNNTLDLARHVDSLGYKRFWLAEHHKHQQGNSRS